MFTKFAGMSGIWSDFFADEMSRRLRKKAVHPMGLRPGEKTPYDEVYEVALLNITTPKTLSLLEAASKGDRDSQKEAMNKMIRYMFGSIKKFDVDLPKEYKFALLSAAEDVFEHVGLPSRLHDFRDLIENIGQRQLEEAEQIATMNVPVHGLLNEDDRARYLEDRAKQEAAEEIEEEKEYGKQVPKPVDLPWAKDEDVVELPLSGLVPDPVDLPSLEAGMAYFLQKTAAHNPFEEELLEPEPASVDPAALETRHFHAPQQFIEPEGVWGLDLDEEDLSGMHDVGPSEKEVKLQALMEGLKDFDDEKLDEVLDLIGKLDGEIGAEEEALEEDLEDLSSEASIPLSLAKSKKKVKKEDKGNPWAICTVSVGRGDKDKYERCVKKVKKKTKASLPSLPGEEGLSLSKLSNQAGSHLIFISEMRFGPSVRTDVRVSDAATSQVVEAKAFKAAKDSPEVQGYIAEMQKKYPGAKVKQ